MENNNQVAKVRQWIEKFIIKLNICPFAATPYRENQIKYILVKSAVNHDVLHALREELLAMRSTAHSNSFLIIDDHELAFRPYLDLYDACEQLLAKEGYDEEFQLASFHPQYQFADSSADAPSNFTNRSPYPLIHILRVEEVADAIEQVGDTSEIYKRNIDLLNKMQPEEIAKLKSTLIKPGSLE